jgi:hypothetical protein
LADGRTVPELGRGLDRVERDLQENYVRKDVFEARIGPLENAQASRKNLVLGIAGTLVGVLASALITYMIARGGH